MIRQEDVAPSILMEMRDMLAIFKPPGWQVHACDVGSLSTWLQELLSDSLEGRSIHFIHRLDSPCSGILLVCTTFEANSLFGSQLLVDILVRDYVIHCSGGISIYLCEVVAQLQTCSCI